MVDFRSLLFELSQSVDDETELLEQMRSRIDPYLLDRVSAFAASRGASFPQALLWAFELFMLGAAEEAWRKISSEAPADEEVDATALNILLEQFLVERLDPSRQGQIEGPESPPVLTQFRRMS